jgi:hypothetical protein
MSTLEDFKKMWGENSKCLVSLSKPYDHASLKNIARSRTQKHVNTAMRYFWASFGLQIFVYSLLSHVIVKYGSDPQTLLFGIVGIFLFLPFTVMLMRKFKRMAVTKPKDRNTASSLRSYVQQQYSLLQSFYAFKKWYEFILVPLAAAIGIFLTFKLYVPGGALAYLTSAISIFVITIVSCGLVIVSENKRSFEQPLNELQKILEDFKLGE